MDGGGRVFEPLAAGSSGGAGSRAAYAPHPANGGLVRRLSLAVVSPVAALGLRRRSVAVPLGRRIPRHLGTALTVGFFGAVTLCGLQAGGQIADFRARYGDLRDIAARTIGFGLDRITISGIAQLSEREVLNAAGISPRVSLPFLDAADIRAHLEALPLVKSAAVRKLYPHEVAITLVEREPFALWQKDGELAVVARDGTRIDALRDARLGGLPLVVGAGANARAAEYVALLDAAGPLRGRIRAGMLRSERRWTLKVDNGIDIRLPETGAVAAMARLVKLDREQHILDKDVLAIDLCIPDRVVVRLTEEAAQARAEIVKKKPQRGGKGIET